MIQALPPPVGEKRESFTELIQYSVIVHLNILLASLYSPNNTTTIYLLTNLKWSGWYWDAFHWELHSAPNCSASDGDLNEKSLSETFLREAKTCKATSDSWLLSLAFVLHFFFVSNCPESYSSIYVRWFPSSLWEGKEVRQGRMCLRALSCHQGTQQLNESC